MTKLLVSVRSPAEAAMAEQARVDLIDVKEPLRGPLGAADMETIDAIATSLGGRLPLSVALGELSAAVTLPPALSGRVQYAKIGLAGCQSMPLWHERWRNAVEALPSAVTAVAVAYADWQTAGAPPPASVLEHGVALGCGGFLLDTFDKQRGSLFECLDCEDVARYIAAARRHHLVSVIAGGLGLGDVAQARRLGPDYIAVRGAACSAQRTGMLDAARIAHLASLVHGISVPIGT